MLKGWRVYYGDGTTVDSTEVLPEDVKDSVVGVVEFLEKPYRKTLYGADWFYWHGKRWQETESIWGGWVDPPENIDNKYIKQGKSLPDEKWEEIRTKMLEDRSWP